MKKPSFMLDKNTMCFTGVSLHFKDYRESKVCSMLSYKKASKSCIFRFEVMSVIIFVIISL